MTIRIHTFSVALVLVSIATVAQADRVEVLLADDLDGKTSGYCLDIAKGQKADANPDDGLQAHTCYSHEGELGTDQVFATDRFSDNVLYMPDFDVCAEVTSLEPGAAVTLADCNGSDAQSISITDLGKISPTSAPELCFTAAIDTRTGRSAANQMKRLTLENCNDELSVYQTWRTRTTDD